MDKTAVAKAALNVERAIAAIEVLKATEDRRAFQNAWSDFLSASHRVFAKLEQGAKVSAPSKVWFGKKIHQRRTDPLLSYIHHARNLDEHGLEHSAHAENKLGKPEIVRVADVGPHQSTLRSIIMQPVLADTAATKLFPVTDRDVTYNPPVEHLGKPIADLSAVGIAELAISYLRAMTAEAVQLP